MKYGMNRSVNIFSRLCCQGSKSLNIVDYHLERQNLTGRIIKLTILSSVCTSICPKIYWNRMGGMFTLIGFLKISQLHMLTIFFMIAFSLLLEVNIACRGFVWVLYHSKFWRFLGTYSLSTLVRMPFPNFGNYDLRHWKTLCFLWNIHTYYLAISYK